MIKPNAVLTFWGGLAEEAYFTRDEALDARITDRFADALEAAKAGTYDNWTETANGTLALI
ncbi:MAG: DUF924 family protein, partial [Aestuariivirgaceae bacterium]